MIILINLFIFLNFLKILNINIFNKINFEIVNFNIFKKYCKTNCN